MLFQANFPFILTLKFSRIGLNKGKYGPGKTPYFDTSHAVTYQYCATNTSKY